MTDATQPIIVNTPSGSGGGMLETLLLAMLSGNGGAFGGNRRNGDSCEAQTDLARQIAEVSANLVQATQAQNLSAIGAVNDVGRSAAATATETRADINRIEGAIELAQSQSESRLGSAIERNGGDTRQSVERNGGDTRTSVERNSGEIRQNISDGNSETRRDIADAQSTLHSTLEARTAEIRQNQARDTAAIALAVERASFETVKAKCDLEKQAAEYAAASLLKAAENTAAIRLEALTTKYELSKQIEDCCCETREAVREEGDKTRALSEYSPTKRRAL